MPREEVAQTTCGQAIQKLGEIFAEDKKLAELNPENGKKNVCGLEKASWRLTLRGWKRKWMSNRA